MNRDNQWKPEPPELPKVSTQLGQMNGLQRATESLRYTFLCFERWISPTGHLREWTRHNAHVATLIAVPALLIMPLVGLVLWQISWLVSMIFGHLLVLLILILLILIVFRIFTALIRR